MSGAQPVHWAELAESTSVWGIRFLGGVYRRLGRWPFRACLYPVVLAHWLGNATARRASLEYLRRLHAHAGVFARRPGIGHGLRHFASFAETLLDKLLALGGRFPAERIEVERAAILARVAEGKGGVIITAHLGCLELCQALAEQVPGFRLTALVHTAHAERFNQLLTRLDHGDGVRLLQVGELGPAQAMLLGQRVAAGEFVAIAGDRVPLHGGRSVMADFLGRPAPFPVGPYVLAAALACPLYTMACRHEGPGYRIEFAEFAPQVELPRKQRQAALEAHAQRYARWLEGQACHAPYDWFNFFPFWEQDCNDHRPPR